QEFRAAQPGQMARGETIAVVPYQSAVVKNVRSGLYIFLGAVGLVLLVSCANVANLQMARLVARRRELAVRIALGAGPGRIVRQLLTESPCLSFFGSVVGIGLALLLVRVTLQARPVELPRMDEIAVNGRALLFTVALMAVVALLSGLVPALQSSSRRFADDFK